GPLTPFLRLLFTNCLSVASSCAEEEKLQAVKFRLAHKSKYANQLSIRIMCKHGKLIGSKFFAYLEHSSLHDVYSIVLEMQVSQLFQLFYLLTWYTRQNIIVEHKLVQSILEATECM
ncbi:hypothetical protein M514_02955, partial [Trichuris suis]